MSTQRVRTIFTMALVIMDFLLIGAAFVLAYQLRVSIDWPEPLANQLPLADYSGMFLAQAFGIIGVLFLNRNDTCCASTASPTGTMPRGRGVSSPA